jgi:hypothetical protein
MLPMLGMSSSRIKVRDWACGCSASMPARDRLRSTDNLQGIITGLKAVDDEGQQLSALTELCELLSISTEESLAAFPIEQVVPLLVLHPHRTALHPTHIWHAFSAATPGRMPVTLLPAFIFHRSSLPPVLATEY